MNSRLSLRAAIISTYYSQYLGRFPDAGGLDTFINSDLDIAGIAAALKSGEECKNLECAIQKTKEKLEKYPHKKKILLFGAYGNGNLGDREMAGVIASWIENEFDVVCFSYSVLVEADYPYPPDRKLDSLFQPLNSRVLSLFDGFIVGGGGILAWPHDLLWEPMLAHLIPVPYALLACGVGRPLDGRLHNLVAHALVASGRDNDSVEELLRVNRDAELCPDPILSLCKPAWKPKKKNTTFTRLFVLSGPRTAWHDSVRATLHDTDKVALFEVKNDRDLFYMFPDAKFVNSIEEFTKMVAGVDLVISERYHGAILALLCGCPTIGVVREDHNASKIVNLFSALGIGQYCSNAPTIIDEVKGYPLKLVAERIDLMRDHFKKSAASLVRKLLDASAHLAKSSNESRLAPMEQLVIERLQHEQETRELIHGYQEKQKVLTEQLNAAQQEKEDILRTQLQRGQENVAQFLAVTQRQEQEKQELIRIHAEQQKALTEQLNVAQQEKEELLLTRLQREQEIADLLLAMTQREEQEKQELTRIYAEELRTVQQEKEGILRTQLQREQEISEQLLAVTQREERDKQELTRIHVEQQKALTEQLNAAQQEKCILTHAYQEQQKALAEQLHVAQQEKEGILRAQLHREQEIAEQLHAAQQEKRILTHAYQEQQKALAEQLHVEQQEKEGILRAQLQREQENAAQFITVMQRAEQEKRELTRMHAGQLHTLRREKQQLGSELADVKQALHETFATRSWRMTAPLRSLASFTAKPPSGISSSTAPAEPSSINVQPISSAESTSSPIKTRKLVLDQLLSCHDQDFVHAAYQLILGRAPDSDGMNYFLGQLRKGVSKLHILQGLKNSSEGRAKKIDLPRDLNIAIRRYRRTRWPLIGSWFYAEESNNPLERELRRIESQLTLTHERYNQMFDSLEQGVAKLVQKA